MALSGNALPKSLRLLAHSLQGLTLRYGRWLVTMEKVAEPEDWAAVDKQHREYAAGLRKRARQELGEDEPGGGGGAGEAVMTGEGGHGSESGSGGGGGSRALPYSNMREKLRRTGGGGSNEV